MEDDDDEEVRTASEWKRVREGVQEKPKKRDEWMTELPPERSVSTILTNRQFSKKDNAGRGDTSGWTDTPQDAAQKRQKTGHERITKEEQAEIFDNAKDLMSQKIMSTFNDKFRPKSLVEQHQAAQAHEKASKPQTQESSYQGFDRDRDLEVRVTDPNQTRTIVAKAKELNTRFSSASGKKFL